MTREEAIQKVYEAVPGWDSSLVEEEVNALVALGLLQLDEQKSKRERFADELERRRVKYTNIVTVAEALAAFDAVEGE